MYRFTIALAALALLATGCAPVPPPMPGPPPAPPGAFPQGGDGASGPDRPVPAGLDFAVEPGIAAPGAAVTLVLSNGTAHQIGYNLCGSGLEQRQGGSWRAVPQDGVCTRELRILAPGQQARYQTRLPGFLAAGEYRFRTGVETPLNRGTPGLDQIHSRSFTVAR